ncbi:MAG: hydrogenase maturation nickel metallochaperone HypA [Nitrospinae bacterium]|nr:hydrogenase maturation nickel metallochaperone HypA [Nitrospinota bacterium]
MHEMSIAMSVAQIVVERAREEGASKALSVTVEVGELSGVTPEALEFCYEAAVMGGLAEGSRLVIKRVPAVAVCGECGETFAPNERIFVCPKCEGFTASLKSGEELAVIEIEVE